MPTRPPSRLRAARAVAVCALLAAVASPPTLGAAPGAPGASEGGGGGASTQNVLLIVADDVGVDVLASYGVGPDPPPTPNLDALAAEGVRFTSCWSNPVCAPSRATIQTGRYGFRTGIGDVFGGNLGVYGLPLEEVTIPEMLALGTGGGWASAAVGKWHLASLDVGGFDGPNLAGYDHFAGSIGNLSDFYAWEKVVNGAVTTSTTYATIDTVDEALAWIATAPEPWFCQVAFNAAHTPLHAPPVQLHTVDLSAVGTPKVEPQPYFRAMVQAVDTEIGRLLYFLGDARERTNVIFAGDNGTSTDVAQTPVEMPAKGTLYQGGVLVPLVVQGPAVLAPGVSDALVNLTDVFATVAEIAGVDLPTALPGVALDSVSLLPYLCDPATPSVRTHAYTELFGPNGPAAGLPVPLPPDPSNVCQPDLGFAGPGTLHLEICGEVLTAGNSAQLVLTGAPPLAPAFIAFSKFMAPLPVFGGTIVPGSPVVVPLPTNGLGELSLTLQGEWWNEPIFLQVAALDASTSAGVALSNAVQADFLPRNRKAIRDARWKLIANVNGGPDELYDLSADPWEQTDLLQAPLSPEADTAYQALLAEIDALLATF